MPWTSELTIAHVEVTFIPIAEPRSCWEWFNLRIAELPRVLQERARAMR